MNHPELAPFALKWNPFGPELPIEALLPTAATEHFCRRIEQSLVREGGFALMTGDPGSGKSAVLRLLADRLDRLPEVQVGVVAHPQSSVVDFYRELGELFEVPIKPHNRWGGFKGLRERWQSHIESTLVHPVLLIDEAQEMSAAVLSELRLLSTSRFDSRNLLSVVLAGDGRLTDKLRREELIALGTRIRIRLLLEPASRQELAACLRHLIAKAGNSKLCTPALIETLAEHALGNRRVLINTAAELLAQAAEREIAQLDEKLFLEVFSEPRAAQASNPRAGKR